MTQTTHPTDGMTDDQLADYYDQTRDLSEFDIAAPEPVIPARQRLDVSITVRFTPNEIDALRATADEQGVKVTTLIRSLAVQHQSGGQVVDVLGARRVLSTMVRELSEKLGGAASASVTVGPSQSKEKKTTRKEATPTKKATSTSTTRTTTAKTAVTTKTTPAKRATRRSRPTTDGRKGRSHSGTLVHGGRPARGSTDHEGGGAPARRCWEGASR